MYRDFDLNSKSISLSLAEAIAWCAVQKLLAAPEDSGEVKRRREMYREGGAMCARAYTEFEKTKRFLDRALNRTYMDSELYKAGEKLRSQANYEPIATPLRGQIRSMALEPHGQLVQAKSNAEREAIVDSVVEKRHAKSSSMIQAGRFQERLESGRFLLYCPDENLACGAAEYVTFGFFDIDNTPPWDTWVAFRRDTLLAWVPGELVELAKKGVQVNPEECIVWLE